jgi:hypothetical protein
MTLKMIDGQCESCESYRLYRNIYCASCLRDYLKGLASNAEILKPDYVAELIDEIIRGKGEREPTAIYRYFDEAGALLYVGISNNPEIRRRQHEESSGWYRFAAQWSVEWYEMRTDAARQELAAIEAERPMFNRTGTGADRDTRARDYLLERGAVDLLRAAI